MTRPCGSTRTSGARPSRLSGRQKRSGPRRPPPRPARKPLNVKIQSGRPGKPTSMRETMAAAWDRVNQNLQ